MLVVRMEDSHMTDSDKIRRITKLGIGDFESTDEVQRRQDDLLERLKPNMWFRNKSKTLVRCTTGHCAGAKCVEVCAFADWRRRLQEIPAAYRLIKKTDGPIYEVRVVRGIWARPIGDLRDVSIAAAKQLNRRALDSVYIPELVAAGTFKVSLAPEYLQPHWICEIHEIVVGAQKDDLKKAFSIGGTREKYDSYVAVTKVENIGQAISDVLRTDLEGWQHLQWPDGSPAKPKKAHREEFYQWLLSLSFGERMIRYGCDRYFNRLHKKPRTIHAKIHKRRPYPTWLIPHMFGNREQPLRGFPKDQQRGRAHARIPPLDLRRR
jgi:hypothetical protein